MTKSKRDIINEIVEQQQYMKVVDVINGKRKKLLIDLQTAHLLKKIIDNVSVSNLEKIERLSWHRLATFAWDRN